MVFSSIGFIFIFFPLFLFSYYKVPETYRNIVLFVGSLVFYLFGSYGHPEYIGLFVASIVLNYFFGLLLRIKKHTWVAVLGVGMNVLCLVQIRAAHPADRNQFLHISGDFLFV